MPLAELTVTQPGQRPLKMEVSDGLISIGRRPDNVVCLAEDTNVSKYHAVIEGRGDSYWVSDLGSSNGTTVNGVEVRTEHRIENGDVISVGGSSTVEFRLLDPLPHAVVRPSSEPRPSPSGSETSANSPPAKSPNAPPKTGGLSLVMVAGVVGGLIVTGAIIAVLFGSGVLGGTSSAPKEKPRSENGPGQSGDAPPAARDVNGAGDDDSTATEVDQSEVDEPTDTSASTSDPEFMAGIAEDNDADASGLPAIPPPPGGASASTVQMTSLVEKLAAQISQKNVHQFDPQFIELINNYVAEYRADPTYFERARKHSDAVNTEFTNKHVNPLLGYVMAMTLSKFNEKADGGIWQLSPAVLKEYAPKDVAGVAAAGTGDPSRATQIAAAHMRDLLERFGADGFMFAVACYGMTGGEYGKVVQKLKEANEPEARYDFWKMRKANVVSGQQLERVARFFAAGVVAENPQLYGLKTKQLSSLYDL